MPFNPIYDDPDTQMDRWESKERKRLAEDQKRLIDRLATSSCDERGAVEARLAVVEKELTRLSIR